jgi:predicted helicase
MHSEIWGAREQKYEWLTRHDLKKTDWRELKPASPFYLFVPRDERLNKQFQSYLSIPEIFPVNSVGIVTARDHLTIHWTSHQVWTTVLNFVSLDPEIARQAYQLGDDVRDWKVKLAQEDLKKTGPTKENIVPILYRPFDIRYTYYTGRSKGFHCMPRGEVMRHMLQDNIALIIPRQFKEQSGAFATANIAGHKTVSAFDINYFFPLYTYPQTTRHDLFSQNKSGDRVPNIAPKLVEALKSTFKKEPSPEQILHYIYAILYSNAYRKKYAEFLKTDFPRVPFTKDYKLFNKLAEKGQELVELHLLRSKKLANPIVKCEGLGDLRVIKVMYDQQKERVHINPEKWFTGISSEAWEYHIGGYQVLEKWLKDRKRKELSSEEVAHYARVVTAIAETISIQRSLDDLFAEVETSLLEVRL